MDVVLVAKRAIGCALLYPNYEQIQTPNTAARQEGCKLIFFFSGHLWRERGWKDRVYQVHP